MCDPLRSGLVGLTTMLERPLHGSPDRYCDDRADAGSKPASSADRTVGYTHAKDFEPRSIENPHVRIANSIRIDCGRGRRRWLPRPGYGTRTPGRPGLVGRDERTHATGGGSGLVVPAAVRYLRRCQRRRVDSRREVSPVLSTSRESRPLCREGMRDGAERQLRGGGPGMRLPLRVE